MCACVVKTIEKEFLDKIDRDLTTMSIDKYNLSPDPNEQHIDKRMTRFSKCSRAIGRHVCFHLILDVFRRPRSSPRGRVNMYLEIVVLHVYNISVFETKVF